ncbi:MAG: prephenate dehydrogenase/arogenate dehydrogenase family protein [Spirochaetes bacterium]|nr:prephenate dehydrogenase/arogenate dehydrogenase family protein [Spirochaetota bacterium]
MTKPGTPSGDGLAACAVHVVGLGLMGGSLAKALSGRVARLTAEDASPGTIDPAVAQGVIDGSGRARDADIVVLAIPPDAIVALAASVEASPGALVIDLGSTKAAICGRLDLLPEGVLAVGGHPMCGLAENGYRNSSPDLYRGARFVLCPTERTTPRARELAESLARAVGAVPVWMDRAAHDAATALTSHLPHLLNFALMRQAMLAAAAEPGLYGLAAGGFDGATRLARTDAAMVAGMLSTNASGVRAALASFRVSVEFLEASLDDADVLREELAGIVAARRAYSAAYGERKLS